MGGSQDLFIISNHLTLEKGAVMALSRENLLIYLTRTYDPSSGLSGFGSLLVREGDRKPLVTRMEQALKQTSRGVRLSRPSLSLVDERTEKNGRQLMQSLFTSNLGKFLEVAGNETSSQKTQWMLTELFRQLKEQKGDCDLQIRLDAANIKTSLVNNALKKAGLKAQISRESMEDHLLLQISLFLNEAAVLQDSASPAYSLHKQLKSEASYKRNVLATDANLAWIQSLASSPELAESLTSLAQAYPWLVRDRLIDQYLKKGISLKQAGLLSRLLEAGISSEMLSALSLTHLENSYEILLAEVKKPKALVEADPALEKAARKEWRQMEQSWQRHQKDSDTTLASVFQSAWEKVLNQEPEPAAAGPAENRWHLIIGYTRANGSEREQLAGLFLQDFGSWEHFAGGSGWEILQNMSDQELAGWLESHFPVAVPESDSYFDQLEEIVDLAYHQQGRFMIHISEIMGNDLKSVLIARNLFLPHCFEQVDHRLIRLAELSASLVQKGVLQPDSVLMKSGIPQIPYAADPEVIPFVRDVEVFSSLSVHARKVLSSMWLSTALTKRMADAFCRGLSDQTATYVLWNYTGEQRDIRLRQLLIRILYPAREQEFLEEQLKKRTLEEYDFLSSPEFSLAKMEAAARAFDNGWQVRDLRRKICSKSTLRQMEEAADSLPPEPEEMQMDRIIFPVRLQEWLQIQILNALFEAEGRKTENGGLSESEKKELERKAETKRKQLERAAAGAMSEDLAGTLMAETGWEKLSMYSGKKK